jgi:hypothetical protein
MSVDLWAVSAGLTAIVALVTLVASLRVGPPPGRTLVALFLLAFAIDVTWLGAQHSDYRFWNPGAMSIWDRFAAVASVAIAPIGVALSNRFGQRPSVVLRDGLVPLILASVSAAVLLWMGLGGEGVAFLSSEEGDILLGLRAGASRAIAVLVLVSSCYAVVRFYSIAVTARRNGLSRLGRAAFAIGAGFAGIFFIASQLLLYGALSLRLITFGSIAAIPLLLTCLPVLIKRDPVEQVLPSGVKPAGSMLLLLGLGMFLIALAGIGQVVHQTMPEHGLLWFRWGGAVLLVIVTILGVIPAVRRPLTAYFDPERGSSGWDFRREWARASAALGPARSRDDLMQRLRVHLETVFGPTGAVFWWAPQPELTAEPYHTGTIVLGPLAPENPLRRRAARSEEVLELFHPTQRLDELPLVVENHELIERHGFRVFGSAKMGDGLGILGLAPPAGIRFDRDQCILIANLTTMVAAFFQVFDNAAPVAVTRNDAPIR